MGKNERIRRQDRPPVIGRVLRIETLPAATTWTSCVLSTSIYGYWTHWDGNHTRPHFEGKAKCHGCQKGQPKRWYGLLHLYAIQGKTEFFVQLTPTAANDLLAQVQDRVDLRGMMVTLHRAKTHKRSPMVITHVGEAPEDVELPNAKDPWPSLARIWGITEQD